MKISAFIYGLTWGGATRRLISLLEGLCQKGHKIELVVVDPTGPLIKHMPEEINLAPLKPGLLGPVFPLLSRRTRMSLSKFALARYLRRCDADIFLSAANHAHITALSAKKLSGSTIPFVLRLSSHVTASLKQSKKLSKRIRFLQAKRLYPLADRVIAVSHGVADDLVDTLHIKRKKVRVVYNPVVTKKLLEMAKDIPEHPWLQEHRGQRKVPVLVAAGRLRKQKGFHIIIKAISAVRHTRPVKLIILGEGKYRNDLEKLVDRLELKDTVDLPGYVPNPTAFMARADLFCHASTFEGLPGVVIEALATGCPVVCTDSPGGASEILGYGRYGILVPLGDPNAFAQGILKGLDKSWNRDELVSRAMDFSQERAVRGYLEVFKELLKNKNA